MLIKDRVGNSAGRNVYFDWYLLILALLLGITGMLTQIVRLADWPTTALLMYFFHLVLAFNLIAFLPYSKLAHIVYRTMAVTYSTYAKHNDRKNAD
ncbi:MAG: hypothetical protein HKM93_12720 [Desulfobacteraceae bacterium]|nr:hypothetical protein [Desulfobacteraceae bacterium]